MKIPKEIKKILLVFFTWKILLTIFAYIAAAKLPIAPPSISYPPTDINHLLSIWFFWDAKWYYTIATHGYAYNKDLVVFFPLLPLLTKFFSDLLHSNLDLVGLILNSVFNLIAVIYIFKLARLDFSEKTAIRSVIYFLFFPTAIFLLAFYTESLFLALSIPSLYYARKGNFLKAVIFATFASATRFQGVILFVPLLIEYFESIKFNFRKVKTDILLFFLIPSGVVSYMIYLKSKFGNPLLFVEMEKNWDRVFIVKKLLRPGFLTPLFTNPIITTLKFIFAPTVLVSALFVGLSIKAYSIRKSYAIYMLLSILLFVSSGTFDSAIRYCLVLVPGFFVLAKLGEDSPMVDNLILIVFTLFLALFTSSYVNGYWAN